MTLSLGAGNLREQEGRKVLSTPVPAYPEVARRLRLTGVVKVQVVIGADGRIKGKNVIGGHPILVSAVEDTLKNWKYAPASGETTTQLEFNSTPSCWERSCWEQPRVKKRPSGTIPRGRFLLLSGLWQAHVQFHLPSIAIASRNTRICRL